MTESASHSDLCHRLRAWAALNERVGDNFNLLAASKTAELCREAAAELERLGATTKEPAHA